MRQNALYLMMIGLVLFVVTACNTTNGHYSHGRFASGQEDAFSYYLAIGYEQLAAYEEYLDQDPEAASRFMAKARKARKGNQGSFPLPDAPLVTAYPEEESEQVVQAHDFIRDALDHFQDQNKGNGRFLAEAQVNFDCWIERLADETAVVRSQDEGVSAPEAFSESCRDMFYDAIHSLGIPDDYRFSIFFDSGNALLNEQAIAEVKKVADSFVDDELWRVRLVGRADPSGNYEDNVILSMRRAIAVRNALAQYGVDPDRIAIDAVGATDSGAADDPAKARRVDIVIAPIYIGFDRNGPDIHEIVPHFFSGAGD